MKSRQSTSQPLIWQAASQTADQTSRAHPGGRWAATSARWELLLDSFSFYDVRERRLRLSAFLGGVQDTSRDLTAGVRGPLERQPLLTSVEFGAAVCGLWEVAEGARDAWLVSRGPGNLAAMLMNTWF